MQHVIDQLLEALPNLTPKLKQAAKVILDRPNAVATTSMRELARQAGVTAPTMIRLANHLGFDDYRQLKEVFLQAVTNYNFEQRANQLQRASKTAGEAAIIQELADAGHRNINHFYQNLDLEAICRAADLIVNAETVYVVAASAPHWMGAYMQYVGKMAIPYLRVPRTSGDSLIEGLIPISSNDVVLAMTYNPYATQTMEAVEFALERGASFIYLTDSIAAPLADKATVLIQQSTDSPQFFPSMVPVVAAIETLLAVVVARSGPQAISAIAEYAEIRKQRYFSL
ncbi:MAG: MurR/RpiR family transcriptional regulator [Pseudomonadota bacterium]